MLKLQDNYTTIITTFEDFILLVYTVIDDLYQQFAPVSVSQRRNCQNARLSDSEIITLSVRGEILGYPIPKQVKPKLMIAMRSTILIWHSPPFERFPPESSGVFYVIGGSQSFR